MGGHPIAARMRVVAIAIRAGVGEILLNDARASAGDLDMELPNQISIVSYWDSIPPFVIYYAHLLLSYI